MKDLVVGLPVYESLYALNRDFEQVLADFARLQELGMFQEPDLGNIFHVIVQETRDLANVELVRALQPPEQGDWIQFHGLIIEGTRLLANRRKAARKKGQRKRRGAESEGV
jgi:hypothetical protein